MKYTRQYIVNDIKNKIKNNKLPLFQESKYGFEKKKPPYESQNLHEQDR